jgi:glyoxylase-like metal-dependent hydrolase (beta-lactamase superfamily II)
MNQKLAEKRYLIDTFDLGIANRTGAYVLKEGKKVLIDPSSSPSVQHVLSGLNKLNIKPEEIDYIIVTHIHLDHAGSVGLLLSHCSNAKVIVHNKGAKHLVNPVKLIAGAKAVYKEKFDKLFNPIVPVPEEKIMIMNDHESLKLSEDCSLTFYNSPGHANHHLSIWDSRTKGIYCGDTLGVYYSTYHQTKLLLPSTSPNQFNPEAMLASATFIESLNPLYIYFGHFGGTDEVSLVFEQLRSWLPIFLECAKSISSFKETSLENEVEDLTILLFEKVSDYLQKINCTIDDDFKELLLLDLNVCAMGLLDFTSKNINT